MAESEQSCLARVKELPECLVDRYTYWSRKRSRRKRATEPIERKVLKVYENFEKFHQVRIDWIATLSAQHSANTIEANPPRISGKLLNLTNL